MIIGVPSGIGDISWVYSKLCNLEAMDYQVADGWPYRAGEYLDLLPQVRSHSYGQFSFADIVSFQNVFEMMHGGLTWEKVAASKASVVMLQPNHHLERGCSLSEWLPDLPTIYHYDMRIEEADLKKALSIIPEHDPLARHTIGISCASYRGAAQWKTWGLPEWSVLCRLLAADGFRLLFMGGAWDDLTMSVAEQFPQAINVVGRTSFGAACALHKRIGWYVGFSSGLGIIRSVLDLPTVMLWPLHQKELSTSWADPGDVQSGRYVALQYDSPETVKRAVLDHVKRVGG